MSKKKTTPKIPVVVIATDLADETFVQMDGRKPRNPWLKDSEKAAEPDQWKGDGPLAKLFKELDANADPALDDLSSIISPSEMTTATKTGKLHQLLIKKGFAFEWDHEERCFWLTEYREVRAKQSKIQEGSRAYNKLEVKKKADSEMKVLEVRVAVYAYDGTYWFTDEKGQYSYADDKSFPAFKKKFMELSEALKMREEII